MNKHTSNKRVFFYCFVSFALFALIAVSRVQFSPCIGGQLKSIHDAVAGSSKGNFIDLNRRKSGQEGKVLILTPLKNAAPYITRYMDLIDALTYPKHLISIAFLVSDTTDNTIDVLRSKADVLLNSHPYNSITILEKDFNFSLTSEERHLFHLQPLRRSYMARSRNFLLNAALKYDHDWVLWLDVDVIHYPRTILHDLQSLDVDIVVPNCFRAMKDGTLVGYDKNNWQETEKSWQLQDSMDPVSMKFLFIRNLKYTDIHKIKIGLRLVGR